MICLPFLGYSVEVRLRFDCWIPFRAPFRFAVFVATSSPWLTADGQDQGACQGQGKTQPVERKSFMRRAARRSGGGTSKHQARQTGHGGEGPGGQGPGARVKRFGA